MLLNSSGNPAVTASSNILDVVIPKQMERNVSCGIPYIDALFAGDGVTPGTVGLVTGLPGTGKTSIMIQMADAITSTGNAALYSTGEESLYQIRKVAKRLDLKSGFIPAYDMEVGRIIAKANQVRAANPKKQLFMFVDSLQCLELERDEHQRGRPPSRSNMQVDAVAKLTSWTKSTYSILFIIGQVTKDGDFAGKQELKHIVDAHLHLSFDRDRKSDTYGERVAEVQKNRFGAAGTYYAFELSAKGVKFIE